MIMLKLSRRKKKEISRRLVLQKSGKNVSKLPMDQNGKVNYGAIKNGESFWVTINDSYVILSKSGDKFFINTKKMENTGVKSEVQKVSQKGYTLEELKEKRERG